MKLTILNRLPVLLILYTACFSTASNAGFNPFNKDKTFRFGDESPWLAKDYGVLKSGSNKRKGNKYYYHLVINEQHILLQLNKNNTDVMHKGTWPLDALEILDVSVDGVTLPLFQWCLDNRVNPDSYPSLTTITKVRNSTCAVNIDDNNFTIKLNQINQTAIKESSKFEITIKLDKYITTLNYSMEGYKNALGEFNSHHMMTSKLTATNAPVIDKQEAVNTTSRLKVKTCLVKAPALYVDKIKPVAYQCHDRTSQTKAEKKVTMQTSLLKRQRKEAEVALLLRKQKAEQHLKQQLEKKRLADLEQKRLQKVERKEQLEHQERENKWGKIETSMWLDRCKQKWANGVSPCYCQSYVQEYAPKGITNTCSK